MYKKKVLEAKEKGLKSSQKEMIKILKERYGEEYLEKIENAKKY
jgi:hypothetical protein